MHTILECRNAASKNDVLKLRSVRTIVIAPAKTGSDSNSNTAVTTTAHPNKANLCNRIPGLLIFSIVVMTKLIVIHFCSLSLQAKGGKYNS